MKFLLSSAFLLVFLNIHSALAQTWQDSIVVLPLKAAVPAGASKLGSIRAGNNATAMQCDYEALIASAKQKARDMRGNLVKITQMIAPAFISKCYSIKADVYHVAVLPAHKLQSNASVHDEGYATLYIYRLADTTLATGYKVHFNDDSVLCTMKSKSRDSVTIPKEGTITLWAETEKRRELKLDVQPGHSYYIRCGLTNGEIRMVPVLQLVDNSTGAAEYRHLAKRKKNTTVKYLQEVH